MAQRPGLCRISKIPGCATEQDRVKGHGRSDPDVPADCQGYRPSALASAGGTDLNFAAPQFPRNCGAIIL